MGSSDGRVLDPLKAEQLEWNLRRVAANMLRIVRGAGDPWNLAKQIAALNHVIRDIEDEAGLRISGDVFQGMLAVDLDDRADASNGSLGGCANQVVRASLQIAASRLVDQSLIQARAQNDLVEAMQAWTSTERTSGTTRHT